MIAALRFPRFDERHRRIVKAVYSGGAARLLTSAVGLLSLPLCVRYLGPERYGVWATVTTTAVWINLLDMGVGNTLTNHISRAFALDDREAGRRYFTNALALTGCASAIAGLIATLLFGFVNWSRVFNTQGSLPEIRHTIAIAVAITLIGLPCCLCSKLLAGYQQLQRYSYATAGGAVASLFGLAAGIVLHVRMPLLYLMSAGCIPAANLALLLCTIMEKPWLMPRFSALNGRAISELLTSGSSFLLIQIASVVVFSSDNLIVSHYLGPAEVTPYNVTWRLAGLAAVLQTLMFPAVWPAYAEAYALQEYAWIRQTFLTMIRGVAVLSVSCAVILALFGRPIIRWWAGYAAVPDRMLLLAMAVWAVINGLMSVESCLLAALNRIRVQAMLSVCAAAVNVCLSVVLVKRVGAVGVIAGTILSYLLVLVVPQTLVVRNVWRRELGGNRGKAAFPVDLSEAWSRGND